MEDTNKLQKESMDQNVRISCIHYATEIIGEPKYLDIDGKMEKKQDDVIEVANKIYKFIKGL